MYFEGNGVVVTEGGACADVCEAFVSSCPDFVDSVRWYEFVGRDLYVGSRETYLPSYLLSWDYGTCDGVGVAE